MEEKKLSREESLELINQMISKAKSEITDSGFGWLLWGGMILGASISTYVLIEMKIKGIWWGWNAFGVISIILFLIDLFRPQRKLRVRTYVDELLRLFDIGFIICIFVIIASINIAKNPNEGFGYFLMVYAFLMLIQGGLLKFKPLIIGAIVNWVGSIAIFINEEFKYDMLITAAAVFIGYIIPGFLLRAQYKRKLKEEKIPKADYGV